MAFVNVKRKTIKLPNGMKINFNKDSISYTVSNGKTSYTMLMWLNENGKNQNYEQGKKFKGTITVLSEQLKY